MTKPRRSTAGLAVRSRAWIERNGRGLLGEGRCELLEQIARHGSISAAGRILGVSYRLAWKWIDEMNEVAGKPLVATVTGGRGGGGATLTPVGEAMLEAVHVLTRRVAEFEDEMSTELAVFFSTLKARPPSSTRRAARSPRRS
jgi:molybdate transport system regulatory protein